MKENSYRSEGVVSTAESVYLASMRGLKMAMRQGKILQARCTMCDAEHNLYVDLGCACGIIPREDAALGVREGSVRDVAIITRVNKMISFKVSEVDEDTGRVLLSRAAAQRECQTMLFDTLRIGDVIPARITHLEPFGAFADIGCGIVSMISIDNISVSRIRHPADRFSVGMEIMAVVREIDYENRRIHLTHKELLGTWEQNAALFEAGQTVSGIVRSVESYGIFVELSPNLAGLAEFSEGITPGSLAGVYIKSILPDKMKIKLAIVDTGEGAPPPKTPKYFVQGEHIDRWCYSPDSCPRKIETVFDNAAIINN